MTSLKQERRAQMMRPIASDDRSLKGALIVNTLVAMYRAGVRDERLMLTCVSRRMPAKPKRDLEQPQIAPSLGGGTKSANSRSITR